MNPIQFPAQSTSPQITIKKNFHDQMRALVIKMEDKNSLVESEDKISLDRAIKHERLLGKISDYELPEEYKDTFAKVKNIDNINFEEDVKQKALSVLVAREIELGLPTSVSRANKLIMRVGSEMRPRSKQIEEDLKALEKKNQKTEEGREKAESAKMRLITEVRDAENLIINYRTEILKLREGLSSSSFNNADLLKKLKTKEEEKKLEIESLEKQIRLANVALREKDTSHDTTKSELGVVKKDLKNTSQELEKSKRELEDSNKNNLKDQKEKEELGDKLDLKQSKDKLINLVDKIINDLKSDTQSMTQARLDVIIDGITKNSKILSDKLNAYIKKVGYLNLKDDDSSDSFLNTYKQLINEKTKWQDRFWISIVADEKINEFIKLAKDKILKTNLNSPSSAQINITKNSKLSKKYYGPKLKPLDEDDASRGWDGYLDSKTTEEEKYYAERARVLKLNVVKTPTPTPLEPEASEESTKIKLPTVRGVVKKQSDNVWSSTVKELEFAGIRSAVNVERDVMAKKEKDLHDIEVLRLETEKLNLEIEKARLKKELEEALKKAEKPATPEVAEKISGKLTEKQKENIRKSVGYFGVRPDRLVKESVNLDPKQDEAVILQNPERVKSSELIETIKTTEDQKSFWNRTGKYLALFVAAAGMGSAITNAYNNSEANQLLTSQQNSIQAQVNQKIVEANKEINSKVKEAALKATKEGLEKAGVKAEIVNGGIVVESKQNVERNTNPENLLNKSGDKSLMSEADEVIVKPQVSKIKNGPDAWANYADGSISNAISVPTLLQKQNNLGNLFGFTTNMTLGFETPELGLRALLSQVNKDQRVTGELNKNGANGNMNVSDYITKYTKLESGSAEFKNYLKIVKEITGANENVQIKDIETKKLVASITKAEGAAYTYNSDKNILEKNTQNKNNLASQTVGVNMMRSGYTNSNDFYGNVNYKLNNIDINSALA